MTRRRIAPAPLAAAVAAGLALFIACWTLTTPPGGVPDERAHHIKAVAAGRGELRGRASRVPLSPMKRRELAPRSTRVFRVPAAPIAATYGCTRRHPGRSASCVKRGHGRGYIERSSYVATYPPFVYVPAGLLGRLSSDPLRSLLLERAVFAIGAALLLASAAFVLGHGRAHSLALLGLLAAATPMVLFLSGSVNVSGLHIAAVVSFGAALLAATRPGPVGRGTWALAASAGCVAVITRAEGTLWVALYACAYWLMRSPRRRDDAAHERVPRFVFGPVVAAVGAVATWQLRVDEEGGFGLSGVSGAVRDIRLHASTLLDQVPGVFGWLDTSLPHAAYLAWYAAIGAFVAAAAIFGIGRQRVVLVIGPVVGAAAAVAFQAVLLGPEPVTGQLIQARYVLPALLLTPLAAGEILDRRFPSPRPMVVWAGVTAVGVFNAFALAVHWRRNAVGTRATRWFFVDPRWSPPLGWWPWIGVATLAVVLLTTGAAMAARRSSTLDG